MDNKLLINVDEAAEMLSISRAKLYQMHQSGTLGPMALKLGRCTRWNRQELIAWIDAGCPVRKSWKDVKRGSA